MTGETFASKPIILDDITKSNLDMVRCNNEVFVSKLNYLAPISYTSLFSVKYVFSGVEKYRVNGVNNVLKKGQCLIVNNDCDVIAECGTGQNKYEMNYGMSSFLTPAMFSEVVQACSVWGNDILEVVETCRFSFLFFDGIIKNNALTNYLERQFIFLNTSTNACDLHENFYYQLCEQVLNFQYGIIKKLCSIHKVKYSTRMEIFKRILKAREIMDATYYQNINLDYIAKECCLSKYFLIKCFKQVFKLTPHQYMIHLKINRAKELLIRDKNIAVAEVAALLNYIDIYTFSKQFKNIVQCSPSDFRNLHGSLR